MPFRSPFPRLLPPLFFSLSCLLARNPFCAEIILSLDFEESDGGFTPLGDTLLWEYGPPISPPSSAWSGSMAWGTELNGDYINNAEEFLSSPPLDLSGLDYPVVSFYHFYRTQEGVDGGFVLLKTEDSPPMGIAPFGGYPGTTIEGEGFSGNSDSYIPAYFLLPSLGSPVEIIFAFYSDNSFTSAGWYLDDFILWDGDAIPPVIYYEEPLPDTDDNENPYTVEALILEDTGVLMPSLSYSTGGGYSVMEMLPAGDDIYQSDIPPQDFGTEIYYYLMAQDGEGNLSFSPADAPITLYSFSVRFSPPEDLRVENEGEIATGASILWDEPEATHTVRGYRVYWSSEGEVAREEGMLAGETPAEVLSFDAPADPWPALNHYGVTALYEEGESDMSLVSAILYVPHIYSVYPEKGYQGEELTLEVTGRYTRFLEGDTTVDMGDGISVLGVEVIDVNLIRVAIWIDPSAGEGRRDIVAFTGDESVRGESLFEVGYYRMPPGLIDIEPGEARQGESLDVVLYGLNSTFLTCEPEVFFGNGVTILEKNPVTDTILRLFIKIDRRAPTGEREVMVECDAYTLKGVVFDLLARDNPAGEGGCSSSY